MYAPKNISKTYHRSRTPAAFSVQCRLQNGNRLTVSWIPEEYAVKGKIVKLYDRDTKRWENGWIVMDIGARQPSDFIRNSPHLYKSKIEIKEE